MDASDRSVIFGILVSSCSLAEETSFVYLDIPIQLQIDVPMPKIDGDRLSLLTADSHIEISMNDEAGALKNLGFSLDDYLSELDSMKMEEA